MNSILLLYSLLTENEELVLKVNYLKESEFISDSSLLNAGFGLIKLIEDKLLQLDKVFLINNLFLNSKMKELFVIDKYLLNDNKQINGYLVYDYLKCEYFDLLKEIKKVLQV